MKFDELIARLEAATEGSLELNEEVYQGVPEDLAIAPPYTTSIDAALTLVLEGWTWDVDATVPEAGIDWSLWPPDGRFKDRIVGRHEKPALALTIAALKARQAT